MYYTFHLKLKLSFKLYRNSYLSQDYSIAMVLYNYRQEADGKLFNSDFLFFRKHVTMYLSSVNI